MELNIDNILGSLQGYQEKLISMRERILTDAVMIGEIPSPTFGEAQVIRFMCDRFKESGLDQISVDESGNVISVIPGRSSDRNILVAAHVDRLWPANTDHTITVTTDTLIGPGITDNTMGAATLTALPSLLEALDLKLDANIILLGTVKSLGRGDLGGLRFFVDNTKRPIHAALCLEGVQIGRLSYASLGMNRGEIRVNTPESRDWESWSLSGAIVALNSIITRILAIETPEVPKTSIILGSVNAGSAYNVPPTRATLRFEVRSESSDVVEHVRERIQEAVEEVAAEQGINAHLNILASRNPGSIGFSHPYVKATRKIMERLQITPKMAPSTSELSVLLDKNIPSLTLGISEGLNKQEMDETLNIPPIFNGLAQIIGTLQAIDQAKDDDEQQ